MWWGRLMPPPVERTLFGRYLSIAINDYSTTIDSNAIKCGVLASSEHFHLVSGSLIANFGEDAEVTALGGSNYGIGLTFDGL